MIDLPRLAPRITRLRLENGLQLVLLPDSSSSLVAVNLWYHVGSKNDPTGRSGLAHLFEHMLFQGSQNVAPNEHFQLAQAVGGSTNASTSFDRTNYFETLPAHCLELGLWLESDRMGFLLPALTQETFEGQRSVVTNERRQTIENQPYGRAFETLLAALFPDGHPYAWPIIGHMDDIAAASLEDVRSFFEAHYTPSNAVLTLAGDIDPAAAERLVSTYFGEIPGTSQPPAVKADRPTTTRRRHDLLLEDDVALPRTYTAWVTPALTSRDRFAGDMLAGVLAGGKSSPLYQDLVQQSQLAQDVTAFQVPMELCSVFMVAATARPGSSLDEIEERLTGHLERAAKAPAAGEHLERTRNQVVTGLFESLQSVETLADLLSRATTYFDDPGAVDSEITSYLEVDADAIVRFCAQHLPPRGGVRLRVVQKHGRDETSGGGL